MRDGLPDGTGIPGKASRFEDADVGPEDSVPHGCGSDIPLNGLLDRTAAEVLRGKGFDEARIRRWFGYGPDPLTGD